MSEPKYKDVPIAGKKIISYVHNIREQLKVNLQYFEKKEDNFLLSILQSHIEDDLKRIESCIVMVPIIQAGTSLDDPCKSYCKESVCAFCGKGF